MIITYESIEAMNASSPSGGTKGMVVGDPSQYLYNAVTLAWGKVSEAMATSAATSPDTIESTGFFLSTTDTGVIELPASTVPPHGDVLLTQANSLALLASTGDSAPQGALFSFVDDLGSTVSPQVRGLQPTLETGELTVSITLLGDSATGAYPYAGVGFDFIMSEGLDVPEMPVFDVSSYAGFTVSYKSDVAIKLQLKDRASKDGAAWFATLPISATKVTTVLTWADFAQPDWASGPSVRDIPTSALIGLQFQYDTEKSSANFTLYSIVINGTGQLFHTGITLATQKTYTEKVKEYVSSWFSLFYEENATKTQGRIRWSDQNHDGSETVSEGISYGMTFAAFMADTPSSLYVDRFDRMWAYWNANLSSKGLMNWRVVGFSGAPGTDGSGSATDADLHVAQALLMMYEKFGIAGYKASALSMLALIYSNNVQDVTTAAGTKKLLMNGDSWAPAFVNPSYLDLDAIKLFELYDTAHAWSTVYTDCLWLLLQNQTKNSAMYGLPSNWCDYDGNDVIGVTVKGHGYDACRTLEQIVSAYDDFKDPAVYDYLNTIASNADLIAKVSSANPVAALALTIGVEGATGTGTDSLGLLSVLSAMRLCSTIPESKLEAAMAAAVANTQEDTDYFFLGIKAFNMAAVNRDFKRSSATTASESAYIMTLVPPNGGYSPYRMQLAFGKSGTMLFRSTSADTWPPIWGSISGGGSSGAPAAGGGVTGPQGHTGLRGAVGSRGHTGSGVQGATGTAGVAGPKGSTGAQGAQGATGAIGGEGSKGTTGLRGITGAGAQGTTGVKGATGSQGHTGAAVPGVTGPQGITGPMGPGGGQQGTTGIQGVTGPGGGQQGATGVRGFTGAQGARGDQGHTGLQGAGGAQGSTGFRGHTGSVGAQGATGATAFTSLFVSGATGSSYQITSMEVVSVLPAVSSRIAGRLYFLIG